MQRISITNPQNVIDGTAKKYYFKLRNTGGPKGDKGDKGDTGATGPQGPQGNAATVSVGSTTTLPVGYDATVTNTGSIYNAVLDFGIPQGPQGPQGAKGDKGDTGAQGETGPRGPQGERGTNATVYVGTTTTTNPGTQARVYNSGTDSNAVLNFEIPRGDVGPQPELVQTTGTSTTKAMSQNATTNALATKQNTIDSSHKLSADLVDDTSTTNKFVTASEKATWNAKQNALTAGDNITISGDTISTPAIVPEVVAELPTTGAEGKLYLTPKNYTRSTATGNPITATVTDGAGSMESFQLDGDTEQATYTGKNLYQDIPSGSNNGIDFTLNNDGTYDIDGQSTAQANNSIFITDLSKFTDGATYTLSATKALPSGVQVMFELNNGNAWVRHALGDSGFLNSSRQSITGQIDLSGGNRLKLTLRVQNGNTVDLEGLGVQLEKSESATAWEKYVGGQPSPSPDYPQPIRTVTGEQTVTVAGKNLFDKSNYNQLACWINISGKLQTGNNWTFWIPCLPSTTYTVQKMVQQPTAKNRFQIATSSVQPEIGTQTSGRWSVTDGDTTTSHTYTTAADAKYLIFNVGNYDQNPATITTKNDILNSIQVELGSTPTAYAPYSKHAYPLDLGSIELCKLDTYQDYIWKDGDDWKVHKATGKHLFNGGEAFAPDGSYQGIYQFRWTDSSILNNSNLYIALVASDKFRGVIWNSSWTKDFSVVQVVLQTALRFMTSLSSSVEGFKAWLASNNTVVHYVLATETDTTITDQTLIAQLEAIRTAALEAGTNTITNTAAGSNLAGDMEIGYYGYNPRNRYDKWLWLDLNNNYEQIGE